ncbi:MAG: DUF4139 domain-containing protein [Bacteroidota bacterium]
MNKTILTIAMMLFAVVLKAGIPSKQITTKVGSVTVYTTGALINQSGSIAVEAGQTNIIVSGVSPSIDTKHIHVAANNDVKIVSVTHEINFLNKPIENPRVKTLQDSVKTINDDLAITNNTIDAYSEERKMIIKNSSIGGANSGVNVLDLPKVLEFMQTNLADISKKSLALEKNRDKLNERLMMINNQLEELNVKENNSNQEIVITISAPAKMNVILDISYLVLNAGWAPNYDLKVKDISKPIDLVYKAKVFNNTCIDWDNVKLTLSTADPNKTAEKPKLTAWTLNHEITTITTAENNLQQQSFQWNSNVNGNLNNGFYSIPPTTPSFEEKALEKKGKNKVIMNYSEISVSELSVDFEIKENYSIPSDSKPYTVDVTKYSLPASYHYFAIPKLDKDAFLVARVTGWEDLNLTDGTANVYYGENYIGESFISTRQTGDTLDLSLGRDKKILVSRVKKQDFGSKSFTGSNRIESFMYELTVKNNNKDTIDIELQDQVPVSQESDITVDLSETSKAERDELSGKLCWKLKLAPGEIKKFPLSFSVKYPKNKPVLIRRFRSVACPKF